MKRTFDYFLVGSLVSLFCFSVQAIELREKVAIVDTGVNITPALPYLCKSGHLDMTGKGLKDVHGHGSNIAGILAKKIDIKKQCLVIIKWVHDNDQMRSYSVYDNERLFKHALDHALKINAKYVNLSIEGFNFLRGEFESLEKLINNGAIVAVAAGNSKRDLSKECNIYPACYPIKNKKNFYVVGNFNNKNTNYGGSVNVWDFGNNVTGFGITMSGTSQATAVFLGRVVAGER